MIEGLKPYDEYYDAGLTWAGKLPVHWSVKRGKALFSESNLPVHPDDEIVTCFRDGQVTLRRNRRTSGFMLALYEAGYQGVRSGHLVIHAMDAFAGAVGVSDSNGKCTPEYIVADPRSDSVIPRYFALLLRFAAHQGYIVVSCPAVRERAPRFRYSHFGDMVMPLPTKSEQASIVRFLDHSNRKIDRFILAKKRELSLISEMLTTVTEEALKLSTVKTMRLSTASEVICRPINRRPEEKYTRLGLYNRGRGIFHKPVTSGSNLGESDFFWVEEGDLVISGQFAWEGAVALARAKDSGCVVSHRYPILRGRKQLVSSEVLLAMLRTKFGAMLLDHHSRGAAGRNRPLNAATLLKEKVPIPPLSSQARITELIDQEYKLSQSLAQTIRLLNEYRTRLTADIVTGKLDVREAAAKLPEEKPEEIVEADLSEDETELEEIES